MNTAPRCIASSKRLRTVDLELSEQAYEHLRRLSSTTGRALPELAADLITRSARSWRGR